MDDSILAGARIIVDQWLALKPKEKLLVIYDEKYSSEAKAFRQEAERAQADVTLVRFTKPRRHRVELEGLFDGAHAAIGVTDYSLLTTEFVLRATKNGLRYLSFPPVTLDGRSILSYDFIREDSHWAQQKGQKIVELLLSHQDLHVTTSIGTDLRFSFHGRTPRVLTGNCQQPGDVASSSFEFFIPIEEDKTEGLLMLDGAIGQIGPLQQPLAVEYRQGKICSIGSGPDGDRLRAYIASFRDDHTLLASEFGIGLNRLAKCLGRCYIEDESALTTCHIGHGRNLTLGGKLDAEGHYDLVMLNPTITANGNLVMRDGKLMV